MRYSVPRQNPTLLVFLLRLVAETLGGSSPGLVGGFPTEVQLMMRFTLAVCLVLASTGLDAANNASQKATN